MTLTGMGVWLLVRAITHSIVGRVLDVVVAMFGYATLMAWHLILVGRLT